VQHERLVVGLSNQPVCRLARNNARQSSYPTPRTSQSPRHSHKLVGGASERVGVNALTSLLHHACASSSRYQFDVRIPHRPSSPISGPIRTAVPLTCCYASTYSLASSSCTIVLPTNCIQLLCDPSVTDLDLPHSLPPYIKPLDHLARSQSCAASST
jgi:hypothetical protein